MLEFAEVAVGGFTGDTMDKTLFDYIIPERFAGKVNIGMRIIVPFANRRLEGYIVGIKDITNIKPDKLKEILDILDFDQIFNEKQLLLCKWVSEEYMCSLTDCLKAVMPSEMVMKEDKYIGLNSLNDEQIINLRDLERKIVEEIKNYKDIIPLSRLNKLIGCDVHNTIKSMVKSDILFIKSRMKQSINDKITKGIELNIECEDFKNIIASMSTNKKLETQLKIIKTLESFKTVIPLNELIKLHGFSRSTINSLINKKLIRDVEINSLRDPYKDVAFTENVRPELMDEQEEVIDKILAGYFNNGNRNYLIHGVTGSGKTEVYMRLIEHFTNNGKQAILLVPEISLTPQTIERFKGRFKRVAVLHSRLSSGERYDEWKRIKRGEVDVVIGARSAIFAPLNRLGIVIIDEEHENSYKSDRTPKYHAREVALKRCEIEDAVLVLGTATPSLETYYDAKNGKYTICKMNKRVDNKSLPILEIVDMKGEISAGNRTIFSRVLYDEIKNALGSGQQVILFLNRRGFSTFVSCRKCGHVMKCPKCDVSLTYHMDRNLLNCHYCDFSMKSPVICPKCGSNYIKYFGIGTQKIESEVKKYFPDAKVLRMDMDTTSKKGSHDKIYRDFKNREADILIGTQMISKGLDFKGVTLVGVVAADLTLNIPDYKACERTYQLITQVAGRAGRGECEGKVIVQTYNPEHYSIQAALHHSYDEFYSKEIMLRKAFDYPPFTSLINIVVSSKTEGDAALAINDLTCRIREIMEKGSENIVVLGPSPAPISKINMYYRWQTILKGVLSTDFKKQIKEIVYSFNTLHKTIKVNFDINPVSLT